MFLCSGVSQWNLRSPVAFPSLSKIFAVYPRLSKAFLEGEGRGREAKLWLKAFRPARNTAFLSFSCGTPRGLWLQLFYELRKKTAEAAVRRERVSKPRCEIGVRGEYSTGSCSVCYPLRFGPKLFEQVCRVEIAACLCNQALTVDPKENGRWECDLSDQP